MITTMNHTSFTVSDLKKAVDFYQNVLGLELVSLAERDETFSAAITGIPGAKLNIAYLKVFNCMIELIEYTAGAGVKLDTHTNNIGSAHICFYISDYDEWIERMKKYNVKFRGELCIVPAGPNKGKRVCYMIDNDGNNLEFMEN